MLNENVSKWTTDAMKQKKFSVNILTKIINQSAMLTESLNYPQITFNSRISGRSGTNVRKEKNQYKIVIPLYLKMHRSLVPDA